MSIRFACACGRPFTVPDDQAGRRSRCPGCQAELTVPGAGDRFEAADDPFPSRRPEADDSDLTPLRLRPEAPAAPAAPADEGGDRQAAAERYMQTARRRLREDDEREDRQRRDWTNRLAFDGGLCGGGLTVLGAAVWIAIALVLGRRLTIPVLLLVFALAALAHMWFARRGR